jgi:hypothetical protein
MTPGQFYVGMVASWPELSLLANPRSVGMGFTADRAAHIDEPDDWRQPEMLARLPVDSRGTFCGALTY